MKRDVLGLRGAEVELGEGQCGRKQTEWERVRQDSGQEANGSLLKPSPPLSWPTHFPILWHWARPWVSEVWCHFLIYPW